MPRLACAFLVAAAAAVISRGATGTWASAGAPIQQVAPAETSAALQGPDDPNLALTPARSNGLLFVFLPGTGGRPSCCELLLQQAAGLAFHAIGLTYDNQSAVGARCLNDLTCYGRVRGNVFDGATPSAQSELPVGDGIEYRLAALLDYLARHDPAKGWNAFVSGGEPAWGSIVLAGHSQGGGEAAFIGSRLRLRGEVTLSSPPDTDRADQPANWVDAVASGKTPITRIVAFVHAGDPFGARISADWRAMKLGRVVSVDSVAPPFQHAHALISAAPLPFVLLASHDATAVDGATPRCPGGSPLYAPVWRYMLEVAAGLPLTTVTPGTGCG